MRSVTGDNAAAKESLMTVVHGVRARLRTRLALLLATMLAAVALPAVVADVALAADATMIPSVKGYGAVSAPGYACSNRNKDDRVVETSCAAKTVTAPMFGDAVITMTATAFANNGNGFSHWENCTVPLGVIGSAVANGDACTLTVSFVSPSVTITPRAVFDDVAGPVISAVAPAYSTVTDRGVSFILSANESMSASECSVDGGTFTSCASVRQLTEGPHQVRARAYDMSANLGATTSASNFRIVDTQLVSGPVDVSADKRPTFTYSSLAGTGFECSIGSTVVWTACEDKDPATSQAQFTPSADLGDGVHTFRVRAVDGTDFDRVPVVRTWRVDTTAPVVTDLTSTTVLEGIVTTAQTATFTWGASEDGGIERFECRLDRGAFAPCTSPKELTALPVGERAFSVRGVDKAGNVGEAVTRRWTVAARDNDGDGFDQRSDCNDSNPRINPNAPDIPDNGIDENCDGADSKSPPPPGPGEPPGGGVKIAPNPARLSAKGSARGTRIVFTRLRAASVPAGARITATCRAKQRGTCPFRTKRTTAKRATVDLLAAFAAKRRGKPGRSLTFRAPAVLTITVTRSGTAPKTLRYTLAKGKFPRVRQV
jgi:Putative metal-binding motif